MRIGQRSGSTNDGLASGPAFEERVIPCPSRDEAAREADRQQALDADHAVWIYVCIDGQWVAKRTPPPFDSRVIACSSRSDAKATAREEQAKDTPDAYWVAIKLNSGRWAARRMKRRSRREVAEDLLVGNLWGGPYINVDPTPYIDPDETAPTE